VGARRDAERVIGGYYLNVDPDRAQLARYGLMVGDLQNLIAMALGAEPVATTVEGRERYTVSIRYPRDYRSDPQANRLCKLHSRLTTDGQGRGSNDESAMARTDATRLRRCGVGRRAARSVPGPACRPTPLKDRPQLAGGSNAGIGSRSGPPTSGGDRRARQDGHLAGHFGGPERTVAGPRFAGSGACEPAKEISGGRVPAPSRTRSEPASTS
jgi:hypothetical protein